MAAAPAAPSAEIPVDPDTGAKGGVDGTWVVRNLDPPGHYQLLFQNTSGIGYINSFRWVPPPGLTVTAITGTEGGHCALTGGAIECKGKIAPPTCTCRPGGQLTVNFNATGLNPTYSNGIRTSYGMVGMYLQIETVTPVPWHIPSFEPGTTPQDGDIPLCHKATKTQKAVVFSKQHPCQQ